MVNDLLNNQNILKDIFEDKRGQCQKLWRIETVEIRLEFFESLNGTTDFLLWNSEQGTGVENGFSQEIKFNKAFKN